MTLTTQTAWALVPGARDRSESVIHSEGASRYHRTAGCWAFQMGRDRWQFDPQQWVPGCPTVMLSNGCPVRQESEHDAIGRGKNPCRVCLADKPLPSRLSPDFGHEPVEIDGDVFCRRCRSRGIDEDGDAWVYPTLWPCMSAVVLGLPNAAQSTP